MLHHIQPTIIAYILIRHIDSGMQILKPAMKATPKIQSPLHHSQWEFYVKTQQDKLQPKPQSSNFVYTSHKAKCLFHFHT